MADLNVKVGVDKSGFTTGLASMENSVKGFGTKVGGILAGAFAFDKIIQGFSNAIEKGDQLQDLANRFGIAASSLQEIGNAASLSGAGLDDVASAMNKLAKNAGEAVGGNDAMAAAFAKIGLSVTDLNGMNPQDLFMALSKAVASGSLGMQAFSVAMQLAGKGAASLMETLRMGPEAITASGQSMGVFSDETIAQLSAASDAIKSFQNNMTIAFGTLAQVAMPLITVFEDLVQFTTMLASAAGSAITGDFAGASEITKEAGKIKIRRDQEEARQKRLKNNTSRVFDQEGSAGESAAADKAFEKSEQAAARHELKLIESQISGKEEAEKMKAAIEEKYRQRSLDREIEMANRKAEIKPQIEDLKAQRAGSGAEMKLLEERAAAAGAQARKSNNDEDILNAQKLAVELQKAKEQSFSEAGFGDQAFSRAQAATERIVGAIPEIDLTIKPTVEMPVLPDVLDLTIKPKIEIPVLSDVSLAIKPTIEMPAISNLPDLDRFRAIGDMSKPSTELRDIAANTNANLTQSVRLENPPDLKPIIDKLDTLIASAGVFS